MRVPNGADSDPDLPEGWVRASLKEVAALEFGQSPPSSTYNTAGHGIPFFQGKAEFGALYPETRKWCTSPQKVAEEGDVLISVRAPVGPTNLAPSKCCIGRGLASIRPLGGMTSKYLLYYLRHAEASLAEMGTGTTFGAITSKTLSSFPISAAPANEQHRLVAKIDELFSQLDAGVANLKRARALLERYRQAVLKAAVTGELTREWREKRAAPAETGAELLQRILKARHEAWAAAKTRAKGSGPRNDGSNAELAESVTLSSSSNFGGFTIPDTWTTACFGQLFNVYVGSTPSRAEPSYWNGSVPWVSSGEVAFHRISSTRETITEAGLAGSSTRLHPPGTVLLAMIGEGRTRGQAAILDIEACNNQNSVAIRVSEVGLPPEYIFYFLVWRYDETRRSGSGGNQPALNKSKVEEIALPLPPHDEMLEIIKQLDERLSNVDALNASLKRQVKRGQALRQSILCDAFSGRLVPQDPRDEPAGVLLEHIRAERAKHQMNSPRHGRAGRRPKVSAHQLELLP